MPTFLAPRVPLEPLQWTVLRSRPQALPAAPLLSTCSLFHSTDTGETALHSAHAAALPRGSRQPLAGLKSQDTDQVEPGLDEEMHTGHPQATTQAAEQPACPLRERGEGQGQTAV